MDEEEVKPEATPEIIPEEVPEPVVEEPIVVEEKVEESKEPEASLEPEPKIESSKEDVEEPEHEIKSEVEPEIKHERMDEEEPKESPTQGFGGPKEENDKPAAREEKPIIEIKNFGQKAIAAIFKKRQVRLEKIMRLALDAKKKGKSITNNDVQLSILVSDATASRYLTSLAKKGMLIKKGAGRDVEYQFPG